MAAGTDARVDCDCAHFMVVTAGGGQRAALLVPTMALGQKGVSGNTHCIDDSGNEM